MLLRLGFEAKTVLDTLSGITLDPDDLATPRVW
jgi:hypothetical protein